MSTLATKGNWNIAKGKVKQFLARLMQDDTEFYEGKVDELVGIIQKRAGSSPKRKKRAGMAADHDDCDGGHK
jgi:uncharacterized protein YjbJ (UPF0337 family)